MLEDIRSPEFIAHARRNGLRVDFWTVNDPELMLELLDAGADGIMTDYPDRAFAARETFQNIIRTSDR